MSNYFDALSGVDCSAHVESKGGFSYLSWPYAVGELKKRHPEATWEVAEYEGRPYMATPAGCFVKVSVTVDGVTHAQIHPVLDNRNKTVKEPDAFQVNTSIQRCLVKAIALHGLGLYIYAGEDLPEAAKPEPVADVEAALKECRSDEELADLWLNRLTKEQRKDFADQKEIRKAELQENAA